MSSITLFRTDNGYINFARSYTINVNDKSQGKIKRDSKFTVNIEVPPPDGVDIFCSIDWAKSNTIHLDDVQPNGEVQLFVRTNPNLHLILVIGLLMIALSMLANLEFVKYLALIPSAVFFYYVFFIPSKYLVLERVPGDDQN